SPEAVDRAVIELEADDATAAAAGVANEIDGEIFDEELGTRPQRLPIESVQHGVAGTVGGGAGALRDSPTIIGRHATERTLIDSPFLGAREGNAPMFQLIDRRGRVAAQIL